MNNCIYKKTEPIISNPWHYSCLPNRDGEIVIQITYKPSFEPWCSYSILKTNNQYFLRRITAYFKQFNDVDTYGSESQININRFISHINDFKYLETNVENTIIIDGCTYHVDYDNKQYDWQGPQETDLQKWFNKSIKKFDSYLPSKSPKNNH